MPISSHDLDVWFTGYQKLFQAGYDGAPKTADRISMEVISQTREENYAWLDTFPQVREWVGPRIISKMRASGFAIKNKPYEATVAVDRDDLEDDRGGIYGPMFRMLGEETASHKDQLIYDLLKSGFEKECFDGQPFFDAEHPVFNDKLNDPEAVKTVSNVQAGAGTPWFLLDTSRAVRPIIFQKRRDYTLVRKDREQDDNVFFDRKFLFGVDGRMNVGYGLWQFAFGSKAGLTVENYTVARQSMMEVPRPGGRPLGVMPNLLIVPPSLEAAAREILKAERNAAGATNIWQDSAELIVTPFVM
jgi:phage major head subunit gpT-like protein